MSEVRGVVVAHANLASALVGAVEAISGVRGALAPVTNERCSPEQLALGRQLLLRLVKMLSKLSRAR